MSPAATLDDRGNTTTSLQVFSGIVGNSDGLGPVPPGHVRTTVTSDHPSQVVSSAASSSSSTITEPTGRAGNGGTTQAGVTTFVTRVSTEILGPTRALASEPLENISVTTRTVSGESLSASVTSLENTPPSPLHTSLTSSAPLLSATPRSSTTQMAKHTSNNKAAIAGGSGVASTLVILAVGLAAWHLRRRRQSRITLVALDRQDQISELPRHHDNEAGDVFLRLDPPTAQAVDVGGADSEAHAEVLRKLSVVERHMQEAMVNRSASEGIIQEMRAMAERVANVEAQLQATREEGVDGESPPAYGSG